MKEKPKRPTAALYSKIKDQVLNEWAAGKSSRDILAGLRPKYPGCDIKTVRNAVSRARQDGDTRAEKRNAPGPNTGRNPLHEAILDLKQYDFNASATIARLKDQYPTITESTIFNVWYNARKANDPRMNKPLKAKETVTMARRAAGFTIKAKPGEDGRMISLARFQCGCGAVHESPVAGRVAPEYIAKKARRDGWEVDPDVADSAKCPTCIAGKSRPAIESPPPLPPKPHPDVGPRVYTTRASLPEDYHYDPVANLFDEAQAAQAAQEAPKAPSPQATPAEVRRLPEPPLKAPQPVPGTPEAAPPPLSSQVKMVVRNLLDGHFDDAAGIYLDGYSDARIATEAGVLVAQVIRMREAAYGPLKDQGDVMREMRGLVAQLTDRLSTLANAVETLQAEVESLKGAKIVRLRG